MGYSQHQVHDINHIQHPTAFGDEMMVELYAHGDELQWIKAQATMEFDKIPGLNIKE